MKKRKYLILALSLLWIVSIGNNTYAQISEGGTPASFAFQDGMQLRSTKKPYVTQINFDVAKLKAEDKVAAEQNMPLRAAVIIPAGLSLEHNGEWSTLPDGQRICRLTIKAPGAIATMLYYNKFDIPEGGRLFIYNPDKTHLLGAYTSRTNPNHTEFATEFVAGDELILEYNAPPVLHGKRKFLSSNNEQPSIEISGISYGYNYLNIHKTDDQLPIGDAGKCMVNINCPEGDNWQDQKKGVALSITPFGDDGILCSGTLVNNTALDQTPYFLTAGHCLYYDETKCSQWNQILYYFHFESPGCSDANPTNSKTAVGAQLLVEVPTNGGSDGALLKLNSSIPTNWNVYYNGWDRRNTGATSGVCIHHPQGDIKKISTFTTTATSVTVGYSDGDKGATLAHWKVIFAQTQSGHGSIEGGSSGSPLFNQNKLVVGTLSAGGDGCSDPASPAVYGKLWYHWDNTNIAGNVSKKMKDYLDPVGSGVEFLNGTYTSGDPTQANLQSLTVNTGTLSPAFNASTTSYTVNVANSVSSITIAATAADANATITGTGSHTLNVGNNTINVVVTAQNKSTTKTYTITVVRAGASTENDFYIAGYEYNGSKWIAKYWKNGTSVALSNGSQDAYGESVAVVGNDVYVAGCEVNSSGKLVAKYWKNGTAVSLTNGNQNAEAFSIVVSGSNVYVTGYESNGSKTVAKYWKNGTAVTLTNGTQDAETVSITVSGNDVYVAGFEYNGNNWVAKYWKNGTATALSNKSQNSYAEEIKIIDGDIYVAGMEAENSILVAKYWKNGTAVTLTNGSQKAQA